MATIKEAVVIVDENGEPVDFPTVLNERPSLKVGDVAGGDYFEIETDGTDVRKGDATTWDEISQSAIAANLFSVAGRIDYNYTELTIDFSDSARYPNEPLGVVIQSPHAREAGSDVRPHIHWIQNSSDMPNILVAYRLYNNNQAVPGSWTLKALKATDNAFTYPGSGNIQQITSFNLPSGTFANMGLSFTFDCKIYRDTANASTLFAGADGYSGNWSLKYYDIHFEKDMTGSRQEFIK